MFIPTAAGKSSAAACLTRKGMPWRAPALPPSAPKAACSLRQPMRTASMRCRECLPPQPASSRSPTADIFPRPATLSPACHPTMVLIAAMCGVPTSPWFRTGPPVFTIQPANQIVTVGSNATFTAYATGQLPLAYQWQYQPSSSLNWVNLNDNGTYSGSQTPTLTISPTDTNMNGEPFHAWLAMR